MITTLLSSNHCGKEVHFIEAVILYFDMEYSQIANCESVWIGVINYEINYLLFDFVRELVIR